MQTTYHMVLTVFAGAITICGCVKNNPSPCFHLNLKNAAGKLSVSKNITPENGTLRTHISSDYTITPDKLPKITKELTLTAWVATQELRGYRTIVYKGNRKNDPERIQFCLDLWNGRLEFKYKDKDGKWQGILINNNNFKNGINITPIPTRQWQHLAATFNNGEIVLYVNGKVVAKSGPVGQALELLSNKFPVLIGAANLSGSDKRAYSFDGLLNDIRIYGKSLSVLKVREIYETEKSNYPSGKIKIKEVADPAMAGYDPQFKYKLKLTLKYDKELSPDLIKGKKTTAKVVAYKGIPALFIDDKPVFPMQMMPSPWGSIKETFYPCRDFAAAAIDLYSDIIYTAFGNAGKKDGEEDWWLGEGKYDFKKVDNSLMQIVKANPKAMILIRIKLNPPKWWQDKYPDEISVYYKAGKYVSTKVCASLASEVWEIAYERMLRDFIRHVESSDYAGHIYGYSPAGGLASEWYWYGHNKGIVDYSLAAKRRFKNWLKERYKNDVMELRESWKNNNVTFENAEIPAPQERTKAGNCIFINPETSAKIIDYRNFQTCIVSGNIIRSSRICKEETDYKKATCVFYGYSMLFEGNTYRTRLGNNGFQGLARVLDSPYVDFICSPTDYRKRRGGEPGVFISAYNGSYRLHNKLYWDEADIRTHFYKQQTAGRTSNMKETISVLQRAFGYSLSKGTAMWWFLIVGNAVFHHDDIMQSIAKMKELGDNSMKDDKTPVAKAALIVDEKSMDYTRYNGNRMFKSIIWGTYLNTAVCGAPFDVYLQSDIMNKDMPDYKLYIFVNGFLYDEKYSKAVKEKLSRNNAVAVWCYAPGYLTSEGFSESTMEKLTGIKIRVENTENEINFKPDLTKKSLITAQCEKCEFRRYSIAPVFYVEDPEAEILGTINGKSALAVKDMGKWKSVYCMVPLSKELLQGLVDYAGIHIYSRSYDVIYANSSYIMLHSGVSGKKTISLPGKYKVTEILSGKIIGKGISCFTDEISAPQTKIYRLSKGE